MKAAAATSVCIKHLLEVLANRLFLDDNTMTQNNTIIIQRWPLSLRKIFKSMQAAACISTGHQQVLEFSSVQRVQNYSPACSRETWRSNSTCLEEEKSQNAHCSNTWWFPVLPHSCQFSATSHCKTVLMRTGRAQCSPVCE